MLVNRGNVQSYALGRLIGDQYRIYRSEKRAQRRGGQWVRKGPGFRVKRTNVCGYLTDRAELLALLTNDREGYRSLIAPYGAWSRQVAEHIAWRDADAEARAAIEAKRGEELQAWLAHGQALGQAMHRKRYPATDGTGSETLTDIAALADRVRALIVQNDPDVLRAGLAEIAAALDMLQPVP